MSEKYTFSREELSEIMEIVRKENVEAASRKFCNKPYVFFDLRKSYKELDEAIVKGQEARKDETPLKQAFRIFESFSEKELEDITELTKKVDLITVAKKYGCSIHSLNKCRRKLPHLDAAIKKGIRFKPIGAAILSIKAKISETKNEKKERKTSKPYNTKGSTRKPPREIVNKTLSGVVDQSDTALSSFRKLMQENNRIENIKRLRNGDYNNMF
jgi:hypothetical protein